MEDEESTVRLDVAGLDTCQWAHSGEGVVWQRHRLGHTPLLISAVHVVQSQTRASASAPYCIPRWRTARARRNLFNTEHGTWTGYVFLCFPGKTGRAVTQPPRPIWQ